MTEKSDVYALNIHAQPDIIFDIAEALGFEGPLTALSVSLFEDESGMLTAQGLFATKPEALAASHALGAKFKAEIELVRMPAQDWVTLTQTGLNPIFAGPYAVFGSHDRHIKDTPVRYPIQIDAGEAFGTGHHATTHGCLLLLDAYFETGHQPKAVLDLGTGSGILAIAAAKSCDANIYASDNDIDSVKTTRTNAAINGVADRITAIHTTGMEGEDITQVEYDLIMANIMAGPLMDMAASVVRQIQPGGQLMLSGVLQTQEETVKSVYTRAGIIFNQREPIDEWVSFIGHKPPQTS